MDTYVSSSNARRGTGQIFGTADELRILRTLNARANAMRRLAGSKAGRRAHRMTQAGRSTGTRVA